MTANSPKYENLVLIVKRVFVFTIVVGNTVLCIPDFAPKVLSLNRIFEFNTTYLKPIFSKAFDDIGLKNRWGVFTHHGDNDHSWKNSRIVGTVTDFNSKTFKYQFPKRAENETFVGMNVRNRLFKFRDNFWARKASLDQPTAKYFAGLAVNEGVTFPILVEIRYEIDEINPPYQVDQQSQIEPLVIGTYRFNKWDF